MFGLFSNDKVKTDPVTVTDLANFLLCNYVDRSTKRFDKVRFVQDTEAYAPYIPGNVLAAKLESLQFPSSAVLFATMIKAFEQAHDNVPYMPPHSSVKKILQIMVPGYRHKGWDFDPRKLVSDLVHEKHYTGMNWLSGSLDEEKFLSVMDVISLIETNIDRLEIVDHYEDPDDEHCSPHRAMRGVHLICHTLRLELFYEKFNKLLWLRNTYIRGTWYPYGMYVALPECAIEHIINKNLRQ